MVNSLPRQIIYDSNFSEFLKSLTLAFIMYKIKLTMNFNWSTRSQIENSNTENTSQNNPIHICRVKSNLLTYELKYSTCISSSPSLHVKNWAWETSKHFLYETLLTVNADYCEQHRNNYNIIALVWFFSEETVVCQIPFKELLFIMYHVYIFSRLNNNTLSFRIMCQVY